MIEYRPAHGDESEKPMRMTASQAESFFFDPFASEGYNRFPLPIFLPRADEL